MDGRQARAARRVDEPTIQTTLSLLTPFAAYLLAESLHMSGILAVVAAGLYMGSHDTRDTSVATRRHVGEVWTMLLYAFNGLVFLLLGLEIPDVMRRMSATPWQELVLYAVVVWVALNVVRLAWVFPGAHLPPLLLRRIREREGFPNPREVFIVGWAGLRGSVTMAAALSIPLVTGNGQPFPGRDLLIFLAGTTIVLTLVINGLTLPWFIRWLGVRGDGKAEREERAARIALAQAASTALRESLSRMSAAGGDRARLAHRRNYERLLLRLSANASRRVNLDTLADDERKLQLAALRAERAELVEMREADVINDETMRVDRGGNRRCGIVARSGKHSGQGMSPKGPSEQGGRDRRSRQGPRGPSPRERTWPTRGDLHDASSAMRPRSRGRIAPKRSTDDRQ